MRLFVLLTLAGSLLATGCGEPAVSQSGSVPPLLTSTLPGKPRVGPNTGGAVPLPPP